MNGTSQIRRIVEQASQYQENLSTREKVDIGRKNIFDFDYPLFDEEYRKEFETHFIRNFYMRNIGSETTALFKFHLETWLMINMPYYNQLYQSELITYDPLTNTKTSFVSNKTEDTKVDESGNVIEANTNKKDVTGNEKENNTNDVNKTLGETQTNSKLTDLDGTKDGTSSTNNVADNFSREIYAVTPDDRLNLTTNDGEGVLNYASNITENNENNKDTSAETTHGTESSLKDEKESKDKDVIQEENEIEAKNKDLTGSENVLENKNQDMLKNTVKDYAENYTYERVGKIGVTNYSKMVMDFRKSFLRIEKELFVEMEELFLGVYL